MYGSPCLLVSLPLSQKGSCFSVLFRQEQNVLSFVVLFFWLDRVRRHKDSLKEEKIMSEAVVLCFEDLS